MGPRSHSEALVVLGLESTGLIIVQAEALPRMPCSASCVSGSTGEEGRGSQALDVRE